MDVAELVAILGLNIDEATWARGNDLIEKARSGVEKIGEAHEAVGKKAEEGAKHEESFGKLMKEGLETVIGYEGIKSITELVEGTMESAIAAKHMGQELGITTQAVQELGYAAGQSGVSSQTLDGALRRLSFGLQGTSSAAGLHGAAKAINDLGLSVSEFKKIPVDEQLAKIADKFAKMEDGSKKVALATQLFGRQAGPQLIPMLNEGSAGIEELRAKARELGVTMGDEGVEQMEKLERAQKDMQARMGALKDEIALGIAPVILKLLDGLGALSNWLRSHQEVLIAGFTAIGAAIAAAGWDAAKAWGAAALPFVEIAAVVGGLALAVQYLWDVFKNGGVVAKILSGIGLAITGIIALLVIFKGTLISLIVQQWLLNAATAVWAFLVNLGLWPILLIVAAVAAVAAGVYLLIKYWHEVVDYVTNLYHWLESKIGGTLTKILAIVTLISSGIGLIIVAAYEIYEHWDGIVDALESAYHWVVDKLGAAMDWLIDKAKAVKSVFEKIVDAIPGVGLIKAGIGFAEGEGAGALKHAIPGYDLYHDFTDKSAGADNGERTAQPITIHAPVTINGTANAEQVHAALKTGIEDTIRQAHHDVRKGG